MEGLKVEFDEKDKKERRINISFTLKPYQPTIEEILTGIISSCTRLGIDEEARALICDGILEKIIEENKANE